MECQLFSIKASTKASFKTSTSTTRPSLLGCLPSPHQHKPLSSKGPPSGMNLGVLKQECSSNNTPMNPKAKYNTHTKRLEKQQKCTRLGGFEPRRMDQGGRARYYILCRIEPVPQRLPHWATGPRYWEISPRYWEIPR